MRDGADLHHQHDARSSAYPDRQRREGGDRVDRQAGADVDARRAAIAGQLHRRH